MKRFLMFSLLVCAVLARARESKPVANSVGDLPPLDTLLVNATADEKLFEAWPSAHEVVDASLVNLPKVIRKDQFWRSRRHIASLLPSIKVGRYVREDNYDRYLLTRDPYDKNRLDDFTLEDGVREYDSNAVWVQWDLSELVFHNDEMESASLERELADFRNRLKKDVISTYFTLKETKLKLAHNVAKTESERISLKTSADAMQALLDEYSGGFFSRHLAAATAEPEEGK